MQSLSIHHCTCGRQELTLGASSECPYSMGLTLIIMRWWSLLEVPDTVLCVGHSSNKTYKYGKKVVLTDGIGVTIKD